MVGVGRVGAGGSGVGGWGVTFWAGGCEKRGRVWRRSIYNAATFREFQLSGIVVWCVISFMCITVVWLMMVRRRLAVMLTTWGLVYVVFF